MALVISKRARPLFCGQTLSFYELNGGEDWKKFKALFVEIRAKKNVLYCEWRTMVDRGNESLGGAVLNLTRPPSRLRPSGRAVARLSATVVALNNHTENNRIAH